MLHSELLTTSLVTVAADAKFTHAVMRFRDDSQLLFRHRVGERWAKAITSKRQVEQMVDAGVAGQLLSAITTFRLNAKHLDIQFQDGSHWDEAV